MVLRKLNSKQIIGGYHHGVCSVVLVVCITLYRTLSVPASRTYTCGTHQSFSFAFRAFLLPVLPYSV